MDINNSTVDTIDLFRDKMNELNNCCKLIASHETKKVIEKYVEMDKLLFLAYCQTNWSYYFNSVKKDHSKTFSYAEELQHYFQDNLCHKAGLFPEGFLDDNAQEDQLQLQIEWLDDAKSNDSVFENFLLGGFKTVSCTKNYDLNLCMTDCGFELLTYFNQLLSLNNWDTLKLNTECQIYERNGSKPSLTCLMGYRNKPNVLWNRNDEYTDCLTLWHEIGHVIHYNLSMANQNFYQFEPSVLIKEIFAFFWEALLLCYATQSSSKQQAKALFTSYKLQSEYYSAITEKTKNKKDRTYESHYPYARYIGEQLVVAYLGERISQQQIIDYMSMGAKLTATTLIQSAGIKDKTNEPITTD